MADVIELTNVPERFERWLAGRPLAQRSRREYARNVCAYRAWLAVTPDRDGWQGDPVSRSTSSPGADSSGPSIVMCGVCVATLVRPAS